MRKATPAAERFWPKVDKNGPVPDQQPELGPCWIWTASQAGGQPGNRYGWFWDGARKTYAHRWAVEDANGPLPKGSEPDHLCFRRLCVKAVADEHGPAHVIGPVTHRENVLRGLSVAAVNAAKTQCPKGHPYDEENTAIWNGVRYCRACNREKKSRQYRARR